MVRESERHVFLLKIWVRVVLGEGGRGAALTQLFKERINLSLG